MFCSRVVCVYLMNFHAWLSFFTAYLIFASICLYHAYSTGVRVHFTQVFTKHIIKQCSGASKARKVGRKPILSRAHKAAAKMAKAAASAATKANKLADKACAAAVKAAAADATRAALSSASTAVKPEVASEREAVEPAGLALPSRPPADAGAADIIAMVPMLPPRTPSLLVDCPLHKIDLPAGLLDAQPVAAEVTVKLKPTPLSLTSFD